MINTLLKKCTFFIIYFRQEWALLLANMKGPGYAKKNPITHYVHVLLCHLPGLLQQLGSVKLFTGQGMESKQILLVEKRLESLEHEGCAHKHRKYNV